MEIAAKQDSVPTRDHRFRESLSGWAGESRAPSATSRRESLITSRGPAILNLLARRLVIFCGIPGSGKTTIARLVAKSLRDCFHIQTDILRSMISRPGYTKEESELVYRDCILIAREALKAGYDAILDGTFLKDEYRDEAVGKLSRYFSSYLVVYVACDPKTAYRRNLSRRDRVPKKSFLRLYEMMQEPSSALRIDSATTRPGGAASAILLQLG